MTHRMIALPLLLAMSAIIALPTMAQAGPTPRDLDNVSREQIKTIPSLDKEGAAADEEAPATGPAFPIVRKVETPLPSISTRDILSDRASTSTSPGSSGSTSDSAPAAVTTQVTGPEGEPRYSAVSGTVSGNTRIVDLKDTFISGILWREKNNKPCNMRFWTLDHAFGKESWEPCTGIGAAAVFDSGHEVRLEQGTAIGRIQVCESRNSKRIKGIKVYGDRINADGTTTYHPAISTDELANCKTWKQDVLCPTGTLSTGLVVHYEQGNMPAATGLQLVCRALSVETVTVEAGEAPLPFEPLDVTPVLKPAILGDANGDKSDKGNEVTETTPDVGFATGAPSYTAISGRRGDETYTFEFGTRALSRIDWSEKSDKACRLSLASLREGEDPAVRIIEQCSRGESFACENATCSGHKWLGGEHTVNLTGLRPAITALSVCTNGKSNGRVKGLEIRGGEILATGTVSSVTDVSKDTL